MYDVNHQLAILPSVSIPRQKPPHCWLIVPCPEPDFLRLFIIVLPAIAERVLILAVRVYLVAKGIIRINLDGFSKFYII